MQGLVFFFVRIVFLWPCHICHIVCNAVDSAASSFVKYSSTHLKRYTFQTPNQTLTEDIHTTFVGHGYVCSYAKDSTTSNSAAFLKILVDPHKVVLIFVVQETGSCGECHFCKYTCVLQKCCSQKLYSSSAIFLYPTADRMVGSSLLQCEEEVLMFFNCLRKLLVVTIVPQNILGCEGHSGQ